MALRYKFVELSAVTAEALEHAVNTWVGQGWQLDDIRFVAGEHGKRPALAFVSFTRDAAPDGHAEADGEPQAAPRVIAADDNDVE